MTALNLTNPLPKFCLSYVLAPLRPVTREPRHGAPLENVARVNASQRLLHPLGVCVRARVSVSRCRRCSPCDATCTLLGRQRIECVQNIVNPHNEPSADASVPNAPGDNHVAKGAGLKAKDEMSRSVCRCCWSHGNSGGRSMIHGPSVTWRGGRGTRAAGRSVDR